MSEKYFKWIDQTHPPTSFYIVKKVGGIFFNYSISENEWYKYSRYYGGNIKKLKEITKEEAFKYILLGEDWCINEWKNMHTLELGRRNAL